MDLGQLRFQENEYRTELNQPNHNQVSCGLILRFNIKIINIIKKVNKKIEKDKNGKIIKNKQIMKKYHKTYL